MFASTHSWVNWVSPDFLELLSFFGIPFIVKTMFSERVLVIIYYIVFFVVKVLKEVRVWFIYFSFQPKKINFRICLVTPSHISIVLDFVWSSIFLTFWAMSSIYKCRVFPFPAIMVLEHTRVHVGVPNSGNVLAKVKGIINK